MKKKLYTPPLVTITKITNITLLAGSPQSLDAESKQQPFTEDYFDEEPDLWSNEHDITTPTDTW